MAIRLGTIEYERPDRPVTADSLRQVLAIGGKDLIRLAWASLAPDASNQVRFKALAAWLCEFFNMPSNEGQGTQCVNRLLEMDLLKRPNDSWVEPNFKV